MAANSDTENLLSAYLGSRVGDPDASNRNTAETNRLKIVAEHPWLETDAVAKTADRLANENASTRVKQSRFLLFMSKVSDAIAPHTACRRGCSHCCHIAVTIVSSEAERIHKTTGRPMKTVPKRDVDAVDLASKKFHGMACPFLVDNECSIYENRPAACRLHHSLDSTPEQCDLRVPSDQSSVPSLAAAAALELPYFLLSFKSESIGDIREFFD